MMLGICLTSKTRIGALRLHPAVLLGRLRQIAVAFVEIEGVEVPVEMDRIDTVVDPIVGVHNGIHGEIHGENEATLTVNDDSIQISPILSQINTECSEHIHLTSPLAVATKANQAQPRPRFD